MLAYSLDLTYALQGTPLGRSSSLSCFFAQEEVYYAGEGHWQPLLRPSFLEGLWQKLAQLWQELGFTPDATSAAGQSALANYAQSGAYPNLQHPNSSKHRFALCETGA